MTHIIRFLQAARGGLTQTQYQKHGETEKMTYLQANNIIWVPDWNSIDDVAEAAVVILETPRALSLDVHQASYLLTTYRLLSSEGGTAPSM